MEVIPNVYMIDVFERFEKNLIACFALKFEKSALIDPGPQSCADYLIGELIKLGIKPNLVAPTHVHIDHAGASAKIAKTFSAKILAHPRGLKHIANPEKLWESSKTVLKDLAEIYGKPESIDEREIVVVDDGQVFDLVGDELITFHAPGHAPHMIVYYLKDSKVLFPSDAVGMYFDRHIIPMTPPPFDYDSALKTIERLKKLDLNYVAFTHFGLAEKDVLDEAEEKIKEWFEVAKECESLEKFEDKLRKDEAVEALFERYSGKVSLSFFKTSIFGMFDAAKRKV